MSLFLVESLFQNPSLTSILTEYYRTFIILTAVKKNTEFNISI